MALPDLTAAPTTDPTSVYRPRDGLYATDLLTVGLVELDLFTWFEGRPDQSAGLAEVCAAHGLARRPADVMLTLFVAMDLLQRRDGGGNRVGLTPLAREHLVASSPWFIAPYYASLRDRPVCRDLLTVLRTGKPAHWGSQPNAADWHRAMETDAFARSFTAAMDCRGVLLGRALARTLDLAAHRHVLDIAGGSGIYACTLAAHFPQLRATVIDKPPVDRIAARAIEERGFSDRIEVLARDMFEPELPGGADVHLWSNVLHDWDEAEVRQLISRSAAALPPGGLFVMHDAFLDETKSGPLHVAEYSVLLMHSTQGRCYGTGEIRAWLEQAGFRDCRYHDTAAARGVLTARKAA